MIEVGGGLGGILTTIVSDDLSPDYGWGSRRYIDNHSFWPFLTLPHIGVWDIDNHSFWLSLTLPQI